MKKLLTTSLVLATLGATVQSTRANTNPVEKSTNTAVNTTQSQTQNQAQKAWLGVVLAPVPEVITQQLGDIIPEKQGVMIQAVSPNSPAAKAGLQRYDIILGLDKGGDKQQIFSAKQLAGLIASSKPNDEINLNVVRKGSKHDIKVSLGGLAVNNPMQQHPMMGGMNNGAFGQMPHPGFGNRPLMRPNMAPGFAPQPLFPQPPMPPVMPKSSAKVNVMQQFESISINKTGDGKVRAAVTIDNNGDKKEFNFEGKYDEVRKQIQQSKELPEDKKRSLLSALKDNPALLNPNDFFKGFPQMPGFSGFNGFFNDPFFNQRHQPAPSWFNNSPRL